MKTALALVMSVLCTFLLTPPSIAAPTLTPPATENVSAGMATLVLQSSESGTGYFTLLPGSGTPCGTGTQVKAGLNSSGAQALYRGSVSLSDNVAARYTVRNLLQITAYTICFTADSPTGLNLQEVPATSNFGTTAVESLTDKQWGAVGGTGFSAGQASYVSLVFAPNGTPYVAYRDSGNSSKVTVMKYLSGVWSAVGNTGFSANQVQTTSLAFAPDGTPYVAYQDMATNNNWKATVKKFDGTSWVTVGNAGFTAGNALYTSLAFAPDGTPYVAFMDYASSYKATVMKYSGGAWSLVGSAGFSAGQVSGTGLAFSADGTPFVVYQDGGNGNKITVQKFNGTSWVVVGSAAFSVATAGYAKLAFSPGNVPFVAFADGGYAGKVTVMRLNGSSWESVGSPGFSAGAASDLSLAFSPDGTPAVALQDGNSGSKATVMKFNGTSWDVLGRSGFSVSWVHPVSLSFSPDGRPYVAYGDGSAGKATVMKLDKGDVLTTVSADKVIASIGESVTITATVSPATATGTVSFMDGTTLLGSAPLLNGVASFSTSALSVGSHPITAMYSGDSNVKGSTSGVYQVEIKPAGFVVGSVISSPAAGYRTNTGSFAVMGTAVSISADPIILVEISVDGGTNWQPTNGTSSWSTNAMIPVHGIFTIKSRATTLSGMIETPSSGISVTIDFKAPTGTIFSAVQNDANSLTVTLNTNANDPGVTCMALYPNACGDQEISLSYDGINWSVWQAASTTKRYSLAMTGQKTTVYAKLRDRAGNISTILNTGLTVVGTCGGAHNGYFTSAPETALCAIGNASSVTGVGPWSWSCSVANGSVPASCSAQQAGGIVYRSSDSGVTWTAGKSGSGFSSGADALLVSPSYASDHTLFLGADGIYKSVDSGDNWKKVLSGYMVKAFAASPAYASDHTLFAGAYLSGIYKSGDGGDTWTAANVGLSPTMVFSLAISPGFSSDQTLFAGLYGAGVFKSSDGGATWSASNAGINTRSSVSLAISPTFVSDATLFTAVTDGKYENGGPHYNIFKSTDGGLTWNQSDSGLSGSIVELGISPGYASDRTVFAVTSTGVYKSTDSGALWTQVNPATSGNSLALSPAYAADQTLFAGVHGVNVFKSGDGGSSWSPSDSNFAVENHLASLATSPSFDSDRIVFALTYLNGPNLSTSGDLSFGAVKFGSTSQTEKITMWNDAVLGDVDLNITSLSLVGPDAGQFRIAPGTCGSLKPTISVGGQCDLEVTFVPSSTGSKSCKLQISSNAAMAMQTEITLTGSGITVSSAITSPVSGFLTNGTTVTVSGTAASVGGDSVTLVEVSADGGITWHQAAGTESWSLDMSIPLEGAFAIKSRATTYAGVVETLTTGISVTIDRTAPSGNIMTAVLNDTNSVTLQLNTSANTPGTVCAAYVPIVCGYQDIALSYDGISWTPWVSAEATKQYSIAMVGRQKTIYAKLRDSAGNISTVLSAPVTFVGTCGAANGQILSAPAPLALCDEGTPSTVSGTGHPWSWTCQGDVGTGPAVCSASIESILLSVGVKDGEGKGAVQVDLASDDASPISIFCPASFCEAHFDFGRRVRITATPDPISLFTAWEGTCSANPCDIEMTADTALTAIFTRDATFKNIRSGDLSNTFELVLSSLNPGDEIRMLATQLDVSSLVLNKILTLSGGWKAQHEAQAADPTVLNGSITIQDSEIAADTEIRLATITLKGTLAIQGGTLRVTGVTLQP